MSTIEAEFAELLRAIDRADIAWQEARKTAAAPPVRRGDRLFARLMRRHAQGAAARAFN